VPHLPSIFLEKGERKTIGRSPQADVVIDEPSLSRVHASVRMTNEGTLSVEDLGSTNGIFINRKRQQTGSLAIGDRVVFGVLEYLVEEAPAVPVLESQDSTIFRSVKIEDSPRHVDTAAIEGLLATSRELMACTDLPGLLDRVLDRLQPVLKPDRSAILLFDVASGDLTTRAVRPPGAYTSVSDFASSTLVREAIRAREVLEVCDAALDTRLKEAISLHRAGVRSAVCVPLLGRTGPIGALYADQMWYAGRFSPEQVEYAAAFAAHVAAALETAKLYEDRDRQVRATLESFARAIDARDKYTAGHSERVTAYTLVLARAVGFPSHELETIRRACMLHDIGKVGVPDNVLLKPGPLTQEERAKMEAHVTIGFDMLLPLPFMQEALPGIRGHHERWDGGGYPDKVAGTNIHPHARIMSVADSYDAMTSARPYRNALLIEEAARRIRQDAGKQFAPEAVEAFNAVEEELRTVHEQARPLTAYEAGV
jgi:putative nucleotidyltransferase with HDIG domain